MVGKLPDDPPNHGQILRRPAFLELIQEALGEALGWQKQVVQRRPSPDLARLEIRWMVNPKRYCHVRIS
ncbi:hypothetical protein GCM10007884_46230 [Methylobacterium brachythecii]|uniref:Transposase n=1 Tax=Methylobacterium brachythecii TaxID=1176177 RepID=A0ABQ6D8L5_9HYPH|nr:hypothetical protein GCM10007884_46230 [Methylobacterium brachythecii]